MTAILIRATLSLCLSLSLTHIFDHGSQADITGIIRTVQSSENNGQHSILAYFETMTISVTKRTAMMTSLRTCRVSPCIANTIDGPKYLFSLST